MDGEPVDFHSTAGAKDAGIAVIYQEPTLFPDLSVAENIFVGRQPLEAPAPDRPRRDAPWTRELTVPPGCAARPRPRSTGPVDR